MTGQEWTGSGYVPDRFTVFELEINNLSLPRVEFAPGKAVLVTDRGDRLRAWGIKKGEAVETFEEYYRAQRGAGGNEEEWYRQRLALVERGVYQKTPLFKGQRQRGKVVFAPLASQVQQVRLQLPEVVVGFDATGTPTQKLALEFPFTVKVSLQPSPGEK